MGESPAPANVGEEERTRLVGGRRRQEDEERRQERAEKRTAAWMIRLWGGWWLSRGREKGGPCNWVMVPIRLGAGATDRVKLDFGDDQISRSGHAVVTYDPRGRRFYVQHGGGTNLTYLGDQPVLTPTELPALSYINIGNTVLRFVPLCGAEFDWQDTEGSEAR